MNRKIVVVKNGWVIEANVEPMKFGDVPGYRISESQVIEHWGTTRGLGELALFGHTPSTVARDAGDGFVPASAVLFMLDCKKR